VQQRVIEARGIVKHYPSPSRPMARLWSALRGNPAGEPWHHVLQGVDFHVDRGETVGLLGRNGAGKTTLLSILAGILPPTAGEIRRHGRIVPILELGGGYDLARSGRANVVAFCRTFGVRNVKIDRILPAVEEFADIGDYFDQPLRTYSSGMRSRVAFAAAMELGADLIILDETLAVGDLSFRLKCYEAIRARQRAGTAFLLVAHNPDTLADLCARIAVLDGGKLSVASPSEAVLIYKALRTGHPAADYQPSSATIRIIGDPHIVCARQELVLLLLDVSSTIAVARPVVNIGIVDNNGRRICSISSGDLLPLPPFERDQHYVIKCRFVNHLAAGGYRVISTLHDKDDESGRRLVFERKLAEISSRGSGAPGALLDLEFTVHAGPGQRPVAPQKSISLPAL
jgi:ABC-type polysaccharide/polyol phosphate transport system ATPase subunit